jgi:hypothetical protein
MKEVKNAIIDSTMLGIEDHGIFTCYISLDYGGEIQGFGGYGLDDWNPKTKKRDTVGFGLEFVKRVLKVAGVDKWEDLKGRHVRAEAEHTKIHRIGHILKDVWFSPEELAIELGLK